MTQPDKISKTRDRVLKANDRLARLMAKDEETKREQRDGRLLKLGILAEQMFLAGDSNLLRRFETAALSQFSQRKADRIHFELDEPLNWFDKTREESLVRQAARTEARDGERAAQKPSADSRAPATPPARASQPGAAEVAPLSAAPAAPVHRAG